MTKQTSAPIYLVVRIANAFERKNLALPGYTLIGAVVSFHATNAEASAVMLGLPPMHNPSAPTEGYPYAVYELANPDDYLLRIRMLYRKD